MNKLKLTKALIGKTRLNSLVVSPQFISNGHWLVNRALVDKQAEYDPVVIEKTGRGRAVEDAMMYASVPCLNGTEPAKTAFTWKRKVYAGTIGDYCIFEDAQGRTVWFSRVIIEGLHLEEASLYPASDTLDRAFVDEDKTLAVMPCKKIEGATHVENPAPQS